MQKDQLLQMKNIFKNFPGVRALDNTSFSAMEGEVHSIIGENGAGKSTLIKILTGTLKKDSGKIFIDNQLADIDNPTKASSYGIATIFQDFSLFDNLTIAENIFIGREFTSLKSFINKNRIFAESDKILKALNFEVPVNKLVGELSISEKQVIEIAKALAKNPKIIVMDEPTSSLAEKEKELLFEIIRKLKKKKVLVIFISHKLDEIKEVADRITILRDGKNVGTYDVQKITSERIIELMTGSKKFFNNIINYTPKDEIILTIKNLNKKNSFENINFNLQKGEILGITGLMGSGKSEIVRSILGIEKFETGEIYLKNKKITNISIPKLIKAGIGFVSEDRKRDSLFLNLSIKENITISSINKFCKFSFILHNKEKNQADKYIKELNIKAPTQNEKVNFLSGGNQQKVAISKCLLSGSEILIFDEPTIGVDIGVKTEIYNIINNLAKEGRSVIIVSSDFREIHKIASRIIILKKGKIKGIFPKEEIDINKMMYLAMN